MMNRLQIPADLREKIDRELAPGEMIQWIDQPITRFLTAASMIRFLFGIPWTAFFLFWTWHTLGLRTLFMNRLTPSMLLPVFGVPFLLIGFAMLTAPITGKRTIQNTIYIVTDRRAILFEGTAPGTIRSYLPNQLQSLYRQENKDGSGNVIITIYYVKDSDGHERKDYAGFVDIRDPKGAEEFLKELAGTNV